MEKWMALPVTLTGMLIAYGIFALLAARPSQAKRDKKSWRRAQGLARLFATLCSAVCGFSAPKWIQENRIYLCQKAEELSRIFKKGAPIGPEGELRLCQVAQKLQGSSDQESVVWLLGNIQLTAPLSMDEINLLPAYVRLELLLRIGRIGLKMEELARIRAVAGKQVMRMKKRSRVCWEESRTLREAGKNAAYVTFLDEELEAEQAAGFQKSLGEYLETLGMNKADLALDTYRKLAEWEGKLAEAMQALRFWDELPFHRLLPLISHTEQLLLQDPGAYPDMDEESRRVYRRRIGYLARYWQVEEHWLTAQALRCARENDLPSHELGYYLFKEAGLQHLARRLHRKAPEERRAGTLWLWQGASWLLSALAALPLAWMMGNFLLGALLLPLLYGLLRPQVEQVMLSHSQGLPLVGLSLKDGIPHRGRVCVVMPVLVSSGQQVEEMFSRLEGYACANREKEAVFALLADMPSCDQPQEEEKEILEAGLRAADVLNRRYGEGQFVFLLRRRRQTRGQWMGWERKRGALAMLNRLILHQNPGDFFCARQAAESLEGCRYVLTLDGDSVLLPGTLRRLVGMMLHPLNQPVIWHGRVTDGYGMMEPRLFVPATDAAANAFTRWHCDGGLLPYESAGYDFYQRLFGRAIFTGKGIYSVAAYDQVLDGALAENTLLSHDLLEGAFLRCGLAEQVAMLDGYPQNAPEYLAREHRWIRGDWQLLPYLGLTMPTEKGRRRQNLGALPRIWMLDNLLRSRKSLFWAGFILLSALQGNLSPALLISLALALSKPVYAGLIRNLRGEDGFGAFFRGVKEKLWEGLMGVLMVKTSLDAILRTLWRMTVTHRGLLDWITAAQAENLRHQGPWAWYAQCLECPAGGLLLIGAGFLSAEPAAFWLLGAFVMLAPGLLWCMGREHKKEEAMSREDRDYLDEMAQKTFRYFRSFMTEDNHFLPPDNVQFSPDAGPADRTSPTNMGLAMVSWAAAMAVGWAEPEETLAVLEKMTESMGKLPRWQGHWYNWYQIRKLEVLPPKVISSVDSGNLLACMMTGGELLQKMLAEKKLDEALAGRAALLAARLEDFCREMKLSALYDDERELFYIALEPEREKPRAHYDLLASEARLLSFLAVARGEAPVKHWKALARAAAEVKGQVTLFSWSGTMFEYLMPTLFLQGGEGTLCREMERAALHGQIAEKIHGLWGISESGYEGFDLNMQYQYYAFGIPELAMRRDGKARAVIAPYASALALAYEPRRAVENLRKLEERGMMTPYGMMEALDFSDGEGERVQSCMAHHQGMSFLAMVNALQDGLLPQTLAKNPWVRGALPVLQEKPLTADDVCVRAQELVLPSPAPEDIADKLVQDPWPPRCFALSNGHYHLLLDSLGGGFSRCGTVMLNRYLPDALTTEYGWQFYLTQNHESLRLWPEREQTGQEKKCRYEGGKMLYELQMPHFTASMEACVHGQKNAEIRHISLKNQTGTSMKCRLSCMLELALLEQKEFWAHPAYAGLFVEISYLPKEHILLAKRRKRDSGERPSVCAMRIIPEKPGFIAWDGSRERLLGRKHSAARPIFLEEGMTCTQGAVLDPAMAFSVDLTVPAGKTGRVSFALALGESMEETVGILKSMGEEPEPLWANAWEKAACRYLHMQSGEKSLAHRMLPFLQYAWPRQRGRVADQTDGKCLWPLGLEMDKPMMVMELSRESHLPQAETFLRTVKWLRLHGVACAAVWVLWEENRYQAPLHHALSGRDEVKILERTELNDEMWRALQSHARIWLRAGENLSRQLTWETEACALRPEPISMAKEGELPEKFPAENGCGGFDADGYYHICSSPTPKPWSHMLTNGRMGALMTADGGGYLWMQHAQLGRITRFFHDAQRDLPGMEWILRQGNMLYTPFARNWSGRAQREVLLKPGTLEIRAAYEAVLLRLICWIPLGEDCFYQKLTVTNTSSKEQEFTVHHMILWQQPMSTSPRGSGLGAQLGNQRYDYGFSELCTVQCWDEGKIMGLGHDGQAPAWPFEKKTGGSNPSSASALSRFIRVPPGKTETVTLMIRAYREDEAPRASVPADSRETTDAWEKMLSAVQVDTPDEDMNHLINLWLPYQNITFRFLGRTGYDQCGGAWGFRDQLQDCLGLLWQRPDWVREHILRAAAHQYEEGDVQHWWHEPRHGVRTRISDDRLFLPYVVRAYVEHTGDTAVLSEKVPYLHSDPLRSDERDRYEEPTQESEGSLLEHCVRAISLSLKQMGGHGLPLMGTGDWNDAMNLLGAEGRGESVWLGFFLVKVLEDMIWLYNKCGLKPEKAWTQARKTLTESLNSCGWDGMWYRRAFADDGRIIGGRESTECRIDAISQAWAVLSGAAPAIRANQAMRMAMERLYDPGHGIMALLEKPFGPGNPPVGYIQGYVPGIRENGGQYTHAALWMTAAWARLGNGRQSWRLWQSLTPQRHSRTEKEASLYQGEPYLVAADIATHPQHLGRAGWTGYTGSASWMLVTGLESILGIRKKGDFLELRPCIPEDWDGYTVRLNLSAGKTMIRVLNPRHHSGPVQWVEADGKRLADSAIPLNPPPREVIAEIK